MKPFTFLELKAEKIESSDTFSGLKLLHIKKKISEILALVGRFEIFDQYSKHDISHIQQLVELCEWVIPEETKQKLSSADCLMIVLAIYFHDLGMLVTKEEYAQRNKSDFPSYKSQVKNGEFGLEYKAKIEKMYGKDELSAEKFLYQEYVRKLHAVRIRYWINGEQNDKLGIAGPVINEINTLLKSLPSKFRLDLGLVCESHHLSDLDDFNKYPISFPYGRTADETVNIHYVAVILRTVDLLHITSDRTPTIEFRLIQPLDPISQTEWIKQMAVSNIRPKVKKDKEGRIDSLMEKDTIEVTAFFDSPEKSDAFFSLISYLNYARKELSQSHFWIELSIKEQGSDYKFPWKDINDDNVRTEGFERELFQFNLDQNKILNLLVGHTLYNDSTVVLRELVQNSIDAIRLHQLQMRAQSDEEIMIKWDSQNRVLDIIDTGTGMDRAIIVNHLLKVGSSRYQDDRFIKAFPDFSPISRFGIGVLTCFLVSNEIEITTITLGESKALNLTIKGVDGKYLLRSVEKSDLSFPIKNHGTKISLKVRHEIEMRNIVSNVKKWILFPACNITIKVDDHNVEKIGYTSPKMALEHYLDQIGYDINDQSIKVVEDEFNGVSLAYALQYYKSFKEWGFIYALDDTDRDKFNPIGTCIEGVRVEFDSPGFIGKRLIAIANAKGKNAPKTNVARSIIDDTSEKNLLLESIYSLYIDHVKSQIDGLYKVQGFSLTWAAMEILYLLQPILKTRRTEDKSEIRNWELLKKSINTIKAVLIETRKERRVVSPNEFKMHDEVVTIDCDLFRSVENMLREVKNDSSLSKVIGVLYAGQDEDYAIKSNMLCGFNAENYFHLSALEGKDACGFKLYHEQRRVDVIWKNKKTNPEKIWFSPNEEDNLWRLSTRNIHFTREFKVQIGDVHIEGLKDEIAIGAFRTIYFLKGSPFYGLLIKLIEDLNGKSQELEEVLESTIVIGRLCLDHNKIIVSEQEFERIVNTVIDRSHQRRNKEIFWSIIDKTDLMDAVFNTKWRSFDTYAWKRSLYS